MRINALYAAPDGLWIATDQGLARLVLDEGGMAVHVASPELRGKDSRSLAAHSGKEMLVGTTDGLYRVDRTNGGAHRVGFPDGAKRVTAIFPVADTAWIGTGTGLFRLAPAGLERVVLPAGLR